MREEKTITKAFAEKYKKVRKEHKGVILNEFTELTGYNRCYAAYVLRIYGKKVRISPDRVIIADVTKRAKRKREKTYDDIVFGVLKKIWLTIVAGLTQSLGLC